MRDQQTKIRFVDLRTKDWSFDRIAKELKVSKQTLINWSKELALEIANVRAIELESLQEQYYLLKRQRIELFGERLIAIRKELENRDLKDIPTDKLFDLFLKYSSALGHEKVDTVFREEISSIEASLQDTLKAVNSWNP